MGKKVNMFSASKAMSERVADYMRVKVYNATLATRYKRDIGNIEKKIEDAPKLLEGSIMAERLPELIEGYEAEKAELQEKYKKLREEAEKFKLTDADGEMYKLYKDGKIAEGVIAWCKAYDLEVEGTDFLKTLVDAISGRKQSNAKQIITSGATQFTAIRNKGDVLKTLYGVMAEKMLAVGTLKPEQLPEDVVAYYKK